MVFKFQWSKKSDDQYPRVWFTFKAKGIKSDELVEYRIEDLSEERFEEAFKQLSDDYLINEPMTAAFGIKKNADSFKEYELMCRASLKQKMAIVCIDVAEDKIVGVNMLWVVSKEDDFSKQIKEIPFSQPFRIIMNSLDILCDGFDVMAAYNVDKYLGSGSLSVAKEYTGRGIGRKLLETRKLIGEAFDLKISHTMFSSNGANRCADVVGFITNKSVTYPEMAKAHPSYQPYETITDDALTAKTWVF